MTTYYKYLNMDGTPCNGGKGTWFLPNGKKPGKWMPLIPEVIPCIAGYHVCRKQDLLKWAGETLWEVEIRGTVIPCSDKVVATQARLLRQLHWNPTVARRFACDCAEHILPIRAKGVTETLRWKAIEVCRKFTQGKATKAEVLDIWPEAITAACYNARNTAALAAMQVARESSSFFTTREKEKAWQLRRLLKYLEGKL